MANERVINQKVLEERRRARVRRRRIVVIAIAVLVIAGLIIAAWKLGLFEKLKKKDPDKVLTSELIHVDYTPRGEYIMSAVDGVVVLCDENGVTGIDSEGKWKWNSTLSAYNPVFSGHGNIMLVTDQGGKSVWAFDGSGYLWRYISSDPLICAYVANPTASASAASGAACDIITICEQEDFESSVTLLAQDKGRLTEKFTRKFGKYHMLSASETSDGSQMAVSGVYFEGGTLSGSTVFLRTSDGEAYSTVLSDGAVYLQLRYLNDGTLFAANSDSLRMIRRLPAVSGKNDTDKQIWTRSGDRKMIVDTGVAGGQFVAAFADDNVSEGGGVSEVRFYDRNGELTQKAEISGRITGMETFSGNIAVYTENSVYLINSNGAVTGSMKLESRPLNVAFLSERAVAVNMAYDICIVSFTE